MDYKFVDIKDVPAKGKRRGKISRYVDPLIDQMIEGGGGKKNGVAIDLDTDFDGNEISADKSKQIANSVRTYVYGYNLKRADEYKIKTATQDEGDYTRLYIWAEMKKDNTSNTSTDQTKTKPKKAKKDNDQDKKKDPEPESNQEEAQDTGQEAEQNDEDDTDDMFSDDSEDDMIDI